MPSKPLAEEIRPKKFAEIVGQDHLLNPQSFIISTIKKKKPLSLILWGPPGSGKTTIAELYAKSFSLPVERLSPIYSGVADLKKIIKETTQDKQVILIVDEIHRFNKAQQDAFLPFVENGKLILIGTTVENPSFYLNKALLSRVRVLRLNYLDEDSLEKILNRYEKLKGPLKSLTRETKGFVIRLSHGDARYLLNLVENLEQIDTPLSFEELQHFLQERAPLFDKDTDQHYGLISALHKSVRGSDPDAALYWFARMLVGGEDPLFIARRLIRMASEDVGLAAPEALSYAIAARDAYEMLGTPEGELALGEVVVYLALCPKSNAIYMALNQAIESAAETTHFSPPLFTLMAPTQMRKNMGYGKGYIYDHNTPEAFSGQNYFPDALKRQSFYQPTERGFEKELKTRLNHFKKRRKNLSQ